MLKYDLIRQTDVNFDFTKKITPIPVYKPIIINTFLFIITFIMTSFFIFGAFQVTKNHKIMQELSTEYTIQKQFDREILIKKYAIEMLQTIEHKNYKESIYNLKQQHYLNNNSYNNFITTNEETLKLREKFNVSFNFKESQAYTSIIGLEYKTNKQPYSIINFPYQEILIIDNKQKIIEKIASVTVQKNIIVDFKTSSN